MPILPEGMAEQIYEIVQFCMCTAARLSRSTRPAIRTGGFRQQLAAASARASPSYYSDPLTADQARVRTCVVTIRSIRKSDSLVMGQLAKITSVFR